MNPASSAKPLYGSGSEFDLNQEYILHCRSGKRSADALNQLKAKDFTKLKNLVGGTLAWSDEVDPSVPKY